MKGFKRFFVKRAVKKARPIIKGFLIEFVSKLFKDKVIAKGQSGQALELVEGFVDEGMDRLDKLVEQYL